MLLEEELREKGNATLNSFLKFHLHTMLLTKNLKQNPEDHDMQF